MIEYAQDIFVDLKDVIFLWYGTLLLIVLQLYSSYLLAEDCGLYSSIVADFEIIMIRYSSYQLVYKPHYYAILYTYT